MGLLDQIGGMMGGKSEGAGMMPAVSELIRGHGGLGGLLEKLRGAGLADHVKSWVGMGPNKTLTPDDVERAIGSERLEGLASALHLDKAAVVGKLAEYLPKVIDKLTPTGQVPPDATVSQLLEGMEKNS